MAQRWYYVREGKEIGPVTSGDLRRIAAAGALAPEDPVRREDRTKWIPAREIKGLFDERIMAKRARAAAKARRAERAPKRPAALATPAPPSWYLARGGQSYGPYPDDTLRQMAQSGQVLPDDQLCQAGGTTWIPAPSVFPHLQPAPSLASTPLPAGKPKLLAVPVVASAPSEAAPLFEEQVAPRGENVLFRTGLHWKTLVWPWLMLVQFLAGIGIAVWIITRNMHELTDRPDFKIVTENIDKVLDLEKIRDWLWIGFFVALGLHALWGALALLRFLVCHVTVTGRGVVGKRGLLFPTRRLRFEEIQLAQVEQSFWGRLLGFGAVTFAGERVSADFVNIRRPFELKAAVDRQRSLRPA